jgi:hypothetical protein
MENTEENCEMRGKVWKKCKLDSEKIWKIWKKSKLNSDKNWKIEKKLWNDMENMEEKSVE